MTPLIGEFEKQKNHLFVWLPVFFALGIGIYFSLKLEPVLWVGFSLCAMALGAIFIAYKHQDKNDLTKIGYYLLIGVLVACFGFTAAQVRTHLVYTPMIVKGISPVGVSGIIQSIEPLGPKDGSRVVLSHVTVERLKPEETPRKVRLKIRKDAGLAAGQRVKVLAGLNPPSPPVAPGAFDFQRMAFFQGLGAVGFAYNAPEIIQQSEKGKRLARLRQAIGAKVESQTQAPQTSVLVALMTGQRGAISESNRDALRGAGLSHLLAISGLHVGMVAGVLFFFSRLMMAGITSLALKYPIKKYAAVIALIGAAFYTLVVGGTIPTQRALIMTGLVMVAIMMDRSPFSLRLVAVAAFAVLFFSPESLTSVSFQMSFAAVAALICFYEWARPFWIGLHRQGGIIRKTTLYFMGVLLTTVIAGAATGLFALFHFQQFALYGVLANMVAVPLMAFVVMPFIVLSYVLMPLGLERFALSAAEWGTEWILASAHWVNNMEGAVWHFAAWPHWVFVLMVLTSLFWMVWQGRLRHFILPIFVILIGLVSVYKQPNILVSSKVDLVGVVNENGSLWLSTGRKERYTADNWMRMNGLATQKKNIFPREGTKDGLPMTCDLEGCRGEIEGRRVAISYTARGWQEDCRWADIVISKTPVPYKLCNTAVVIDYFDVWREGAHALWLSPERVKVKTVEEARGLRPWTQTSANRKKREKSKQQN